MRKAIILAALLVSAVVILIWPSLYNPGTPQEDCIGICVHNPKGPGWENGPCLAEAGQAGMDKNWVCDVAHNPRQPVDDLKENQCSTFGPGKHFVEVDTECRFIRSV